MIQKATDVQIERRCRFCLPQSSTASALRSNVLSRLNTRPARTPVNASPTPSRAPPHDSGPVWIARPSLCDSFIHNTLPVLTGARRTAHDTKQAEDRGEAAVGRRPRRTTDAARRNRWRLSGQGVPPLPSMGTLRLHAATRLDDLREWGAACRRLLLQFHSRSPGSRSDRAPRLEGRVTFSPATSDIRTAASNGRSQP
jgi:hypothetical protein